MSKPFQAVVASLAVLASGCSNGVQPPGGGCPAGPKELVVSTCNGGCQQVIDCPDPRTFCIDGFCRAVFCGPGPAPSGTSLGKLYSPCSFFDGGQSATCVADGQDFTSLDSLSTNTFVATCVAGGFATTTCNPTAVRLDAEDLCVPGSVCVATTPDGGNCTQICNPAAAAPSCPSGQGCLPNDFDPGYCFPLTGGCVQTSPNELTPCGPNAVCACPGACIEDAASGPNVVGTDTYCETSCTTTADCTNPATACRGGHCAANYCVATPTGTDAGAVFGGTCNAAGAGDGLCLQASAYANGNPMFAKTLLPYGLCLQTGTLAAGSPCTNPQRGAPLCAPGTVCTSALSPDGGSFLPYACAPACSGPGCAAGQNCYLVTPQVVFGDVLAVCD